MSRRNGGLSRGPVTVKGKARSALNATRHGLCPRTLVLGAGEEQAELDALRAALLARHVPPDAAEAHWVDELVFVAWRQRRLRALEDAVLARAGAADQGPPLPSLATLVRYRGRLDRDWRRAVDELALLRRGRTALLDPAQLRALAAHIEHGQGGTGAGARLPARAGSAPTKRHERIAARRGPPGTKNPRRHDGTARTNCRRPCLDPARTNPRCRRRSRRNARTNCRLAALARLEPRRAA